MIIILNKDAGSGTAIKKWNKFYKDKIPGAKVYNFSPRDKSCNLKKILRENINKGNYEFIAAGGDGTINLLLNLLLEVANDAEIKNLKIGAIGIGSSNDFHKPVKKKLDALRIKVDFSHAKLRDVGYFTFKENESYIKKYFLINASIGITAKGNYSFNNPIGFLKHIKKISSKWAIIYTALKTLSQYKNQSVQIASDGKDVKHVELTNLGIIKNPNFSGNLSYGGKAIYDDGLLHVILSSNMNIIARLKFFGALQKHKSHLLRNVSSWNTKELVINAEQNFYVEFDGEVIKTDNVKFGIHHKYIKVCQ
jgi:diacylglycerol kinase family enzyme